MRRSPARCSKATTGVEPLDGPEHAEGRAGVSVPDERFYWRVEQAATGVPLVYTYVLDPATGAYREGDVFTGVVKVSAPCPVEFDLGQI
ncbi:hypothetical protein [Streptomyces sp. P9(2023)]|uniref:hypothetical protein n=1 Tax=Streptomyces sp. P9(2023) TaxID=3064394 RepID=UPI0037DDC60E